MTGDQLIFSRVDRDHAGTYVCTGHTDMARHRDRDTVEVVVQCKSISANIISINISSMAFLLPVVQIN